MRWLLVMAVIVIVTVVPELGLRAAGFRWGAHLSIRGIRPQVADYFVPDKDLLWKRSRADPGVNRFGFKGREIESQKPPGVIRIVVLGDSCAEEDYARLVERCLNEAAVAGSARYECIPLAVAGYSSYQGKVIATKLAASLDPDLAVICYGWNDHWLAYRGTDEDIGSGRPFYTLAAVIDQLRTVQLCRKVLNAVTDNSVSNVLDQVRVPAEQYRKNLTSIANVLQSNGASVMFMTSPTSHYRVGVPDYIVQLRLADSKERATDLHRQYNQIVRQVAAENGLLLLDLENELERRTSVNDLFKEDGIHFTQAGLYWVSEKLCSILRTDMAVSPN